MPTENDVTSTEQQTFAVQDVGRWLNVPPPLLMADLRVVNATPQCRAMHAGVWAIEQHWFKAALNSLAAGTWPVAAGPVVDDFGLLYQVNEAGITIIPIEGFMAKGLSKFGGTSSVQVRKAVRLAGQDPSVKGILLHIDSPGGTVAGTSDLADDVRGANKLKPVFAQVDDLGASAAFWVAAQARFIGANRTAEVGSIGAMAVVEDTFQAAENAGVKVHVITSAPGKGLLVEGAPVTDAALKEVQDQIDELAEHFNVAVAKGRGMPIAEVRKIADGRTHLAAKAKTLGMVDAVQGFDETMAMLLAEIKAEAKESRSKVASAGRRLRLAGGL